MKTKENYRYWIVRARDFEPFVMFPFGNIDDAIEGFKNWNEERHAEYIKKGIKDKKLNVSIIMEYTAIFEKANGFTGAIKNEKYVIETYENC